MGTRHLLSRWRIPTAVFFLAMAAGWLGILVMSRDYFRDVPHPFIIEKLPLPHEAAWLFTLKTHVVAALISLPACLVLLSTKFRARFLRLHRWLGRVTAIVVLLALVPSGFVLALTARGGFAGTAGFMLSGVIVVVAMVRAVARARAGDHGEHRRAARHVVAQLSVAVTSRALLAGLGFLGLHGDDVYVAVLWIPVLGSALVVEAMEPRAQRSVAGPRWLRFAFAGLAAAVLLAAVLLILRPVDTFAAEPRRDVAETQLTQRLVRPYEWHQKRYGSFSRAPSPSELRARLLEEPTHRDSSGALFVRFALDEHYGGAPTSGWRQDALTGCVYPGTGAIYVQRSERYVPASSIWTRDSTAAPAGACVAE